MKIAVVPNLTKKEAMACTEKALTIFRELGCDTVLKEDLFDSEGVYHETTEDALCSCDIFVAVGGDSTIIHTAKLAASFGKPTLGINAGTLGFTAGVERDELSLLPNLLRGEYREERRLMLAVKLVSRKGERSFLALNDAVVSGESSKIIDYQMALGQGKGYHCRADGLIVATPTGSTAYSMAAGGPVIQPDTECLVYTPICPHSLFNRSVIFAGDTQLTVTIPENRGRLFLTVDGEGPLGLSPGDRLIFSRSQRAARFLMLSEKNFYDVLNQKIIGRNRGIPEKGSVLS